MPGTNLNNLDAYNEIEALLGGTGAQPNDIVAVRAIAVLEGVSGGPTSLLDDNMVLRLNAIDVGAGGPGTHENTLDALNSIVVLKGGVGGHFNDLDALNEWVDFAVSLPFDLVSGGVVGYSLRQLSSDFSGSLIRVRRSSDDAELDIGFLTNGDLDIASLDTFCAGTDGFVTTIYDQSGNADNMVQATASKQPQIVSSGTTIVDGNGNPIAQFDGINDSMQAVSVALDSYFSIYVVGEFTLAAPMFIEHSANAGSLDGFFFFGTSSSPWQIRRTAIHNIVGEAAWMGSALAQVTFIYGGTGAYYLNGSIKPNTTESGSDVGDTETTNALNLLARNQASLFSDGNFYEMLVFDGAHSSADQDSVEGNQKTKYTTP